MALSNFLLWLPEKLYFLPQKAEQLRVLALLRYCFRFWQKDLLGLVYWCEDFLSLPERKGFSTLLGREDFSTLLGQLDF